MDKYTLLQWLLILICFIHLPHKHIHLPHKHIHLPHNIYIYHINIYIYHINIYIRIAASVENTNKQTI